jgi:MoaD family protein
MPKVRLEFLSWFAAILGTEKSDEDTVIETTIEENRTVKELLNRLALKYPRFEERIFDTRTQKLNTKVAVFYNGRHLEMANGFETVLRDGDTLTFLPPIEGG